MKLTSFDLLTALKVTRGLRFQHTWLTGTVTCGTCYVALSTCFDVYWMTFGLYIWNWLQMTYLQSWKQQEVSDFSVHDWMGLSHVEHVKWLWSPLLGSLDDTWSQYLLLTLNDLHIALKVARGLKFQWTWLNGTVTCKACEVALSTF